MKLLFLITSLHGGGAERVLSNISQNFPDDVECTVLLNKKASDDYPFKGQIITLGIEEDFRMNLGFQLRVFFRRIKMLRKLKRNGEYQACISFMDSSNFANILSGNKKCKTIVSIRTNYTGVESKIYKRIIIPMASLLYRFADAIVPVSGEIKNELVNKMHINANKIRVIYNAFNIKQILENAQQPIEDVDIKNFIKDSFVYVNMGRLTRPKGQPHLIRSFSKVRMHCKNAKLIIMGDGKEREYLEGIVKLYNLEAFVKILPFQSNPYRVLASCNAYVFPSLWEGYPNALCEALICGLPCIAADFKSGAREILAPDTDITYQNKDKIEYAQYGILVPVCSGKRSVEPAALEREEELLADAMVRLQTNDNIYKRYKNAANERATQLDIKPVIQQWINLINDCGINYNI